ncbi:MAG: hypothetical protein ACYTG0_24635 [Planctomycetota bacterium]|jgi:hypothetical protein
MAQIRKPLEKKDFCSMIRRVRPMKHAGQAKTPRIRAALRLVAGLLAAGVSGQLAAEGAAVSGRSAVEISEAEAHADGFLVHQVRCEYQAGETQIKILLPDRIDSDQRQAVLYVLPVEAGDGRRWPTGSKRCARTICTTNIA